LGFGAEASHFSLISSDSTRPSLVVDLQTDGHLIQTSARNATDLIVTRASIDRRRSPYLDFGDLPAGLCLLATCGLAVVGLWHWRRQRKTPPAADR
jgi:hypothetical protein